MSRRVELLLTGNHLWSDGVATGFNAVPRNVRCAKDNTSAGELGVHILLGNHPFGNCFAAQSSGNAQSDFNLKIAGQYGAVQGASFVALPGTIAKKPEI
jgi:hypothetical protein